MRKFIWLFLLVAHPAFAQDFGFDSLVKKLGDNKISFDGNSVSWIGATGLVTATHAEVAQAEANGINLL